MILRISSLGNTLAFFIARLHSHGKGKKNKMVMYNKLFFIKTKGIDLISTFNNI